jgi:RNA polymerase sigma factor (sigma-70 family)
MATAAIELPSLARDEAFERLYRRYANEVYRYALAVLRNPTDAEDVTQTTFLNAYRAMQRGEEPRKPQNWLIKIAHNVARSRYQRASRRVKEVPLEDHIDQLAVPEEDKPDVAAVLEALGRLPLNQRAALVMRELEGRTYAEIAETLGVSVTAVETLIFRARKTLRLKASSVRVLTVVQLPASLAQLVEGGGVVAGGSALFGSGFVFKAAIAVVVGVVAAGIGGDHMRPAQAAPETSRVAAPPWTKDAELALVATAPGPARLAPAKKGLAARTASPAARPDGVRTGERSTSADPAVASASAREPATGSASTETASTETASTKTASTETSASPTSQVTQTVSSAASSLPVSTPTVTVPQLPATPTVELPSLPPPPPPPPLP